MGIPENIQTNIYLVAIVDWNLGSVNYRVRMYESKRHASSLRLVRILYKQETLVVSG